MRLAALLLLVSTVALAEPPVTTTLPGAQGLRAQRLALAAKVYQQALSRMKAGAGSVDDVFTWSQRWRDAERGTGDGRAADERALDRAKLIEALVRERVTGGAMPAIAADEAQWWRVQAELDAAPPRP